MQVHDPANPPYLATVVKKILNDAHIQCKLASNPELATWGFMITVGLP